MKIYQYLDVQCVKKSIKSIKESSVLCENNHCFNISKKGYVI